MKKRKYSLETLNNNRRIGHNEGQQYIIRQIREYICRREEILLEKRKHFEFGDVRYTQLTSHLAELECFRNEFKRFPLKKKKGS